MIEDETETQPLDEVPGETPLPPIPSIRDRMEMPTLRDMPPVKITLEDKAETREMNAVGETHDEVFTPKIAEEWKYLSEHTTFFNFPDLATPPDSPEKWYSWFLSVYDKQSSKITTTDQGVSTLEKMMKSNESKKTAIFNLAKNLNAWYQSLENTPDIKNIRNLNELLPKDDDMLYKFDELMQSIEVAADLDLETDGSFLLESFFRGSEEGFVLNPLFTLLAESS